MLDEWGSVDGGGGGGGGGEGEGEGEGWKEGTRQKLKQN